MGLEQEIIRLQSEIKLLREENHTLQMKMGAMKIIMPYPAPVCREKLQECLNTTEVCDCVV